MLHRTHASHIVAVLGIATLSIGTGLGSVALWEPDEPRFAEATRQMLERADFLTPYFNGVPRFEKPILLYWLQALSYTAFGVTEFAARLPAALAGIGSVLILYALTARIATRRAALVAALALTTMFRFVTYARQGLTDVPVLFFIIAALYCFHRASERQAWRGAAWLGWACIGLGVLTKGPVGLLPIGIWGSYALVRREKALVTSLWPGAGILLATVIALPWYVAMLIEHGRAYFDFAIGHEIVARALSERSFEPARGPFYYFKVWPGDAAPWSILFVAAIAWSLARWRRLDAAMREPIVLAVTWFLCVFFLFSLSRSKVTHYVLPAYPAAAIVIGVFVDRVAATRTDTVWWRVPMGIIAAAAIAGAMVAALFVGILPPDRGALVQWLVPLVLAAGGTAMAYATWKSSVIPATYALPGMLAATFGLVGAYAVPAFVEPFKPMPILARAADRLAPRNAPIALLGRYGGPSLVFYSHRNVHWLDDDSATVSYFSTQPGALAVMPLLDFQRLAPLLPHVQPVATAEEFNVHIERITRRRMTRGRIWVLVARSDTNAKSTQ